MVNRIELSETTISYIASLCTKIKSKNPSNTLSMDMAMGIASYASCNGYISNRQALWLCRNADYLKLKRPKELVSIAVNSTSQKPVSSQTADPILVELLRRVKRIEKLLKGVSI